MKLAIGAACILIGIALGAWQLRRYRDRKAGAVLEDLFDLATGWAPEIVAVPIFLIAGAALIWMHFDNL